MAEPHAQVVALDEFENKVKQLDVLKNVTLYCSLHEGKELELYCETCEEFICLLCTVNKHCRPEHKYDLMSDTFERHKAEMTASLEPVDKLRTTAINALEQLEVRSHELDDQEVAVEAGVRQHVKRLHELLEMRQAEEIDRAKKIMRMKRKNLGAQKEELEMVLTRLDSCLSFVNESLRTGSQGEVMKVKKTVTKQIKEVTDNFKPDMLPPCEKANVKFVPSPEVFQACEKIGRVKVHEACPEKCQATGKGLEVAVVDEKTTVALQVVDHEGEACALGIETIGCELVSEIASEKTECTVKKTGDGQYEISYQPASQGRHQLHIKVQSGHIKGSPFPVIIIKKFDSPMKTISGVSWPWGVAVNQRGEIIVAECDKHCVSIFSPAGEKLRSFGSTGSGHGQFNYPYGVAVDDDDNIHVLVADKDNHRIQKFTSDGKFIATVGKRGYEPLEFNSPIGIAIHPLNKKVYVADQFNHRIQILNPDLTYYSSFGSMGSDDGQFVYPLDVALDSTGNVYVINSANHLIQVFTAEGEYVRKFENKDELKSSDARNCPTGITIDSDNLVYVIDYNNARVSLFTCEGKFLTAFGSEGSELGQFNGPRGITVDKNRVVYVSDTENHRLQLF